MTAFKRGLGQFFDALTASKKVCNYTEYGLISHMVLGASLCHLLGGVALCFVTSLQSARERTLHNILDHFLHFIIKRCLKKILFFSFSSYIFTTGFFLNQ